MKNNIIYIHTNKKQHLGAIVAKYMIEKYSTRTSEFEIKIIFLDDFKALYDRQGMEYTRSGVQSKWDNEDLQSFTLLRFLPPELMNYKGRSIVIDPDVFVLTEIMDLFDMDMDGKAILCRKDNKGNHASSVMLMDNSKLKHWTWENNLDALFNGERDYRDWMNLALEADHTIGELDKIWNSFDELTPQTRMLHNTQRLTQPWRTGLPIDFSNIEKKRKKSWQEFVPFHNVLRKAIGKSPLHKSTSVTLPDQYQQHPDINQRTLFFEHMAQAIEKGYIDDAMIENAIVTQNVRPDIRDCIKPFMSQNNAL